MTLLNQPLRIKNLLFMIILFCYVSNAQAQADSQSQNPEEKKETKAKSSFKLAAGVNFNNLSLESDNPLDSKSAVGYNLGISYKRGRFFYYEIGARYNQRKFGLRNPSESNNTANFTVSAIDVPLTLGVNITSFVDRLVGLRVFGSAVPSFTINEDVSDVVFLEDQINSFTFYGQLGVGIDITVIFIETGFNFGLNSIVDTQGKAEPSQFFVNLGFRF